MSKEPSRFFQITLKGNQYQTSLTNRNIINWGKNKTIFSEGIYSSIPDATSKNTIDLISALYAFFPDVKKDMTIDVFDMHISDTKEIMEAMNPFFEWYIEWQDYLSDVKEEERVEEDS